MWCDRLGLDEDRVYREFIDSKPPHPLRPKKDADDNGDANKGGIIESVEDSSKNQDESTRQDIGDGEGETVTVKRKQQEMDDETTDENETGEEDDNENNDINADEHQVERSHSNSDLVGTGCGLYKSSIVARAKKRRRYHL